MASLIISDTHFGWNASSLHDPARVEQLMQEVCRYESDCREAILLGDIFDFWRARPESAVKASLPFLLRLEEAGLKIRYIVGNHDHHLVVQKQEAEFMERAARGDIFPVYIPALCWKQTFAGIDVEMLYPCYTKRLCRRTFLFTHGHHLDGIQTLTLQIVERMRRLSGEEILPSDLEMMMTYAYESIYRTAYIGEMVSFEDLIWRASGLLHSMAPFSRQRPSSVQGQYDAILQFIRDRHMDRVDCFIYGDTHRSGIFQRRGGPLAVNSGCFTREKAAGPAPWHATGTAAGQPGNRQASRNIAPGGETSETYMLLDDGCLALRQLGRQKPLFICELF
ncbi:MAG TPA: metallophosphoesterase [Methanothrix sp.]|jgi:UDP-2,3-diacylglucosamine pyrophosphatase LpxH|nr:metallophosphoesterase [Methanothrix sp.]HOV81215.1 metallophosphoesterase [Methanothrix sp.]HPC88974.1 metallophosphoesterase [Methanothrix sp.]HQE86740.1 metallophosphoesterase [Methanothrix sp.]HQI68999.1 metallophosphoesterase [Methanothrix sp.]